MEVNGCRQMFSYSILQNIVFVVERLLLGKIWICIRLKLLIISSHEIRVFNEVLA